MRTPVRPNTCSFGQVHSEQVFASLSNTRSGDPPGPAPEHLRITGSPDHRIEDHMAASVYVPSSVPSASGARLAPVIPLRRGVAGAATPSIPQVEVEGPVAPLQLVAPHRGSGRRTLMLVAGSLLVALLAAVLTLGVASASSPELEVGGHVVLQPGETLWDIAVRSAPPGVDARRQLADIRRINGFGGGSLEAWTVVLLPG
jgi:hypothetical protein